MTFQTRSEIVNSDISETKSSEVYQRIRELLDHTSVSSNSFGNFPAFTPVGTPLEPYVCGAAAAQVGAASTRPAVKAAPSATATLLPVAGTIVQPGDAVEFIFDVAGGNAVDGAIFGANGQFHIQDGPGPFAFQMVIPTNAAGEVQIVAGTFGPGPENYAAETSIFVLPAAALTALSVAPQELEFFAPLESGALTVWGSFDDGIERHLSSPTAGTTYGTVSGTNTIVEVSPEGVLTARGTGDEIVYAANSGLTNTMLARVRITNLHPQLDGLSNQTMVVGRTISVPVHATDLDGNAITLTVNDLPSFAKFTDNGSGNGVMQISPGTHDVGSYTVVIKALDDGTPELGAATLFSFVVSSPGSLNITKAQAKLNFAQSNRDSFAATAVIDLGSSFSPAGKSVTVNFGGVEIPFVLDAKGKGINLSNRCSLKFNPETGMGLFSVKGKAGNWRDQWAAYGMTSETILKPGRSVTVPVVVVIGNDGFTSEKTLNYTATAEKKGQAK